MEHSRGFDCFNKAFSVGDRINLDNMVPRRLSTVPLKDLMPIEEAAEEIDNFEDIEVEEVEEVKVRVEKEKEQEDQTRNDDVDDIAEGDEGDEDVDNDFFDLNTHKKTTEVKHSKSSFKILSMILNIFLTLCLAVFQNNEFTPRIILQMVMINSL